MDREVQTALKTNCKRRLADADLLDRGAIVEVFLAIGAHGRRPQRFAFRGEVELRQLVEDFHLAHPGLVGKLVAKADPVVVDAEDHIEAARELLRLGEGEAELVIAIADKALLTPGLLPRLVEAPLRLRGQAQIALDLGRIHQKEAEP